MTDIIERLRAAVPTYEGTPIAWPCEVRSELLLEAAAEVERLREALTDMLSGWRYIRETYGDLAGIGWDRVEQKARETLEAKP